MTPRVDPLDLMAAVKALLTDMRKDFRADLVELADRDTVQTLAVQLQLVATEMNEVRGTFMAEIRADLAELVEKATGLDRDEYRQMRHKADDLMLTFERRFMEIEKAVSQAVEALAKMEPPRGERGEPGERGEKGMDGLTGERGERGERGEPGERGEKGMDGLGGERGERGEKGDPGEPGERGEPGEKGMDGQRGIPGENGADGTRGPPGHDGLSLEPRGKFDNEAEYHRGDIVANHGGSWCAVRQTRAGEVPGEESDPANPAWMAFSQKGRPGKPGEQGPQGFKGDKGERGEPGLKGERGPGIAKLAWNGWQLHAADEEGKELEPVEFTALRHELGEIRERLEALETKE